MLLNIYCRKQRLKLHKDIYIERPRTEIKPANECFFFNKLNKKIVFLSQLLNVLTNILFPIELVIK